MISICGGAVIGRRCDEGVTQDVFRWKGDTSTTCEVRGEEESRKTRGREKGRSRVRASGGKGGSPTLKAYLYTPLS